MFIMDEELELAECPKCGSGPESLIAIKLATASVPLSEAEEYDPEHIEQLNIGMLLDEIQRIECLHCNLTGLPEVFDYGDYDFTVCERDERGYYLEPSPTNFIYHLTTVHPDRRPSRAYFTNEVEGRIYFTLSKLMFAKTVAELPESLVTEEDWIRKLAAKKFEELKEGEN